MPAEELHAWRYDGRFSLPSSLFTLSFSFLCFIFGHDNNCLLLYLNIHSFTDKTKLLLPAAFLIVPNFVQSNRIIKEVLTGRGYKPGRVLRYCNWGEE